MDTLQSVENMLREHTRNSQTVLHKADVLQDGKIKKVLTITPLSRRPAYYFLTDALIMVLLFVVAKTVDNYAFPTLGLEHITDTVPYFIVYNLYLCVLVASFIKFMVCFFRVNSGLKKNRYRHHYLKCVHSMSLSARFTDDKNIMIIIPNFTVSFPTFDRTHSIFEDLGYDIDKQGIVLDPDEPYYEPTVIFLSYLLWLSLNPLALKQEKPYIAEVCYKYKATMKSIQQSSIESSSAKKATENTLDKLQVIKNSNQEIVNIMRDM